MRPIKIISAIFVIAIAFCGCKKEVIEIHPEMEGKWITYEYDLSSTGKTLDIRDGKNSSYYVVAYQKENIIDVEGKAKIKGDEIKIKNQTLHIESYPAYTDSGDFEMIIDGERFLKMMSPRILSVSTTSTSANLNMFIGFDYTNHYFKGNAVSYDLQYKLASTNIWSTINNWIPYAINNLIAASVYECRLKAHYPWGSSEYSRSTTFSTQ